MKFHWARTRRRADAHLGSNRVPITARIPAKARPAHSCNAQLRCFQRCRNYFGHFSTERLLARSAAQNISVSARGALEADVVMVGAGIIGLSCCLSLLESDSKLSVVLIDQKEPCAGATGAGQGYIWLAHRDPSSPLWEVATRSKVLWEQKMAETGEDASLSQAAVEWQPIGSMLIASCPDEAAALQAREHALCAAGINASYQSTSAAPSLEPAVSFRADGGALVVPHDSQINGRRTAAAVLDACRAHGKRFTPLFHEGVSSVLRSSSGDRVTGVQTEHRAIIARQGVVLACGAWAGEFLARELSHPAWAHAIKPRRGHLLEMPRPEGMPEVRRGLMEMGYTKHYSAAGKAAASAGAADGSSAPDITFTATTSASGTLLIGSSREFSGWDAHAAPEVVDAIMQRAVDFLPDLNAVDPGDIAVRVGLRPFAAGGPFVGPVPGLEGLVLAAGHEGSGLTLCEATSELVADYLLGRSFALSKGAVAALQPTIPC